jgi:glycosyltransferase involved in cell wall biosynthesis
MIELSVVVPIYNEAEVIEASINSLLNWLAGIDVSWELILVDDGSTDDTKTIISRQQNVRLISHSPNQGRGYALRQGMLAAKGEIVITTEADGSWDNLTLHRLYRSLIANRADLAIASPYLPGGSLEDVPFSRRFLSRAANQLSTAVFGRKITMATGMTRAYRRTIIDKICSKRCGKEFHLDVISQAILNKIKVIEIPATIKWSRQARVNWLSSSRLVATIFPHLHVLFRHILLQTRNKISRLPAQTTR